MMYSVGLVYSTMWVHFTRPLPLEAHFSDEFEDLLRKLDRESSGIQAAIRAATDLSIPNPAELYDDLHSEFESAAAILRREQDSAKRVLGGLVQALEGKRARAFERVDRLVTIPELNTGVVDSVNSIILKHNQVCEDFQSRIDEARKRLEADSVAGSLEEFVRFGAAVQAAKGTATRTAGEVQRIEGEMVRLEREIVDHRQPAEQLNEDLRNYLGHSELRLEIKETGYAIMRQDVPAEGLSEGETTAIALLYFLKSLDDRRFDLARGVVVLDDPVSSLDSNALFYAFAFIRERTKDAKQLIVLTHNFTFFREMRSWFMNLNKRRRKETSPLPARFYMVTCADGRGGRSAQLRQIDPLLTKYESDYHYLFACFYRAASTSLGASLDSYYFLPNVARRLLETFVGFRRPDLSGDLSQKLQELPYDDAKKRRMLRFLNAHSHRGAVGEPEHDLSALNEAPSVLVDLMDMIRTLDPGHFAAMESLVTAENSGDEAEPGRVTETPA